LKNLAWQIDVIIPVPLGVARQKERGYNQAALIARPVALGTGRSYRPKALSRVRETKTQVGLSIEERRKNVGGAFKAERQRVVDKNVLLIDDVLTTGSTMEACAAALIEAGAGKVYGLTLARAL
jgi:ComF family protein